MPKISELPLANKLKEEDYIPIVQDGVTKKVKGTHFVTEEEYSLDAFSPTIAANDKAMYKFGEGDTVDFSDSAYDGAYKSAILKGQTLVNSRGNTVSSGGWSTTDSIEYIVEGANSFLNFECTLLPNTKYLTFFEFEGRGASIQFGTRPANGVWDSAHVVTTDGICKTVVTTGSDSKWLSFIVPNSSSVTDYVKISRIMIIPYQEGMENWDIPYFEGMQSVRMPVLRTTGKNMVNILDFTEQYSNGYYYDNPSTLLSKKVYIDYDGQITLSCKGYSKNVMNGRFRFVYTDGTTKDCTFLNSSDENNPVIIANKSEAGKKVDYITFTFSSIDSNPIVYFKELQVEGSTEPTSYEPYKSNILSTPSDLELRGIGDVQDTLDLLTGELKENFVAISCNGTEDWRGDSTIDNIRLAYILPSIREKSGGKVICDKLPTIANNSKSVGVRLSTSGGLYVQIDASLGISVKEWLTSNEINIIYEKRDELKVVKTVGLSGTPFGYKGGHIIKSSAEGSLLPKFEYEVAVSRGAQISQNTSTLIKHDEKITELLKKTAAAYINQKAEIAYLLNMSSTLEEVQTIPFIEDDYVNDDCMVDSDMVMDDMEVEPEKEIIDNVDTLLINLIYDLIELNDTLGLSEKAELFRQSGLIDKHNYEIIKEKLNPTFKEEDYAGINQ